MNKLTLGSLFDGSGGFPLGGLISGITPVWASEIEPFPIRVTTKRMPFVKHYGDVSGMNGGSIEPVDIITFGSPCQDMSIAGKRSGLDGSRSSLFYEAIRIIREMRCATNGKYPRYIVWENVPGAFSSNKGEDFRCVLESICRIKDETVSVPSVKKWHNAGCIMGDDYSVSWRVLDAQYFGVPQRRKRIYLVADFAGGSAGKILFESEGLSGYSAQSFRAWQRAAGGAEESTDKAGCLGIDGYNSAADDVAATLGVNCGLSSGRNGVMVLNDQGGERMDVTEDVTATLRAASNHPPLVFENHSQDTRYTGPLDVAQTVSSTYGMGGNNQPFVVETPKTLKIRSGCDGGGKGALIQDDKSATLGCSNDQTVFVPTAFGICSKDSNSMKSDNPHSGFYEAETSRTLDGNGGNPSCNQGGIAVVAIEGNGSRPSHKGSGYSEDEVSFTLNATEQHGVAYGVKPTQPVYTTSKTSYHMEAMENVANTLIATDYKDPPTITEEPYYIVRRLTPTECARLQGFPDWWCADLGTEKPSDEELYYWYKVFEAWRLAVSPKSKPKTSKQIRKWLISPHSDSAEYKMWGNGVALPCVVFVLSGIVYYSQTGAE